MRKKREIVDGAFYHVTSRTNDKIRVFENNLGRKIMLITLQDAKDKFKFRLTNFCVMPTHIHLLIKPDANTREAQKCLTPKIHVWHLVVNEVLCMVN
jgi:putative transposase